MKRIFYILIFFCINIFSYNFKYYYYPTSNYFSFDSYDIKNIEILDIENDGDSDILVAIYNKRLRLLVNDGSGIFTDQTTLRLPNKTIYPGMVKAFDADNDGYKDIYVGNGKNISDSEGTPDYLFLNNGTGYFTDVTSSWLENSDSFITEKILINDFDGDNYTDIVATVTENDSHTIKTVRYYKNCNGSIKDYTDTDMIPVYYTPGEILVTPVRNKTESDLFIFGKADNCMGDSMFMNSGGYKQFYDFTQYYYFYGDNRPTISALSFDVNLDSYNDIIVSNIFYLGTKNKLLLNTGVGKLYPRSERYTLNNTSTQFMLSIDFQSDGLHDILEFNYNNYKNRLLVNTDTGYFINDVINDVLPTDTENVIYAIADDIDGDNDKDIIMLSPDNGIVIYYKNTFPVIYTNTEIMLSDTLCTTLTAVNCSDSDNDNLYYTWYQISGPPSNLNDSYSVNANVSYFFKGVYKYHLYLSDGTDTTGPETVTVNVSDTRPFNLICYEPSHQYFYDTVSIEYTLINTDSTDINVEFYYDDNLVFGDANETRVYSKTLTKPNGIYTLDFYVKHLKKDDYYLYYKINSGVYTDSGYLLKFYVRNDTFSPGFFKPGYRKTLNTDIKSLSTGDLNNDGYLDIAFCMPSRQQVGIMLSDADGSFPNYIECTVNAYPVDIVVSDLNNDKYDDIIIASGQSGIVSLFYASSSISFSDRIDYYVGTNVSGVTVTDINADGLKDIIVSDNDFQNEIYVLFQLAPETFVTSVYENVGNSPISTHTTDLNRDGLTDLLVNNYGGASISVLTQNNFGGLDKIQEYDVPVNPYRLYTVDTTIYSIHYPDLNKLNIYQYSESEKVSGVNQIYFNSYMTDIASVTISDTEKYLTITNEKYPVQTVKLKNGYPAGLQRLIPSTDNGYTISSGDFNYDGYPDIVYGDSTGINIFYRNLRWSFDFITPAVNSETVLSSFYIEMELFNYDTDIISLSLYYDSDTDGYNGTLIAEKLTDTIGYDFKTTSLADGKYYIYVLIDDGTDTEYRYCEYPVTVAGNHPVAVIEDTYVITPRIDSFVISAVSSYDTNGDRMLYYWSVDNETGIELDNTNDSVLYGYITKLETYVISVYVKDTAELTSNIDTIYIYPYNYPPEIILDYNAMILRNNYDTISCKDSYDTDGDTLVYLWSQVSGGKVTFSDVSACTPIIISQSVDTPVIKITISDGYIESSETFLIDFFNTMPVIVMESETYLSYNIEHKIDIRQSYDSNSDDLSYSWTQIAGSSLNMQDYTSYKITLFPDTVDLYRLQVTLTDSYGLSVTKEITIYADNDTPSAILPIDTSIPRNITYRIDGSNSSDKNNDTLKYYWHQTLGPSITFENYNSFIDVSNDSIDTAQFILYVFDGLDTSSPEYINIYFYNQVPEYDNDTLINARADDTVTLKLDFTGDTNGDNLYYKWHLNSGPENVLFTDTEYPLQLQFSKEGYYGFSLDISDGYDTVTATGIVVNIREYNVFYVSNQNGYDTSLGTSSNPFKTISRAVQYALPGDTVIIYSDTYYENISVQVDNISIICNDTAVIIPSDSSTVFDVESNYLYIEGLTIKNSIKKGMYIRNSNNIKLKRLSFSNNIESLVTDNTDNVSIENCRFKNDNSNALNVQNGEYVILKDCIFNDNDNGIIITSSKYLLIDNNKIISTNKSGLQIYYCDSGYISNNTVSSSGWYGILVSYSNDITLINNTVEYNKIDGINANNSRRTLLMHNNVYDNVNGINTRYNDKFFIVLNTVDSNHIGIKSQFDNDMIVVNNDIVNSLNQGGIFNADTGLKIIGNNISNNQDEGLYVQNCLQHTVAYNNLIDNKIVSELQFDDALEITSNFDYPHITEPVSGYSQTENNKYTISRLDYDNDLVYDIDGTVYYIGNTSVTDLTAVPVSFSDTMEITEIKVDKNMPYSYVTDTDNVVIEWTYRPSDMTQTHYIIYLSTMVDYSSSIAVSVRNSADTHKITGLNNGRYYFNIRLFNGTIWSNPSYEYDSFIITYYIADVGFDTYYFTENQYIFNDTKIQITFGSDNIDEIRFADNISFVNSAWQDLETEMYYYANSVEGLQKVYFQGRTGEKYSQIYNMDFILDFTAPSLNEIYINNNDYITDTTTVKIKVSGTGIRFLYFNTDTSIADAVRYDYDTEIIYTLNDRVGTQYIYCWTEDNVSNISDSYSVDGIVYFPDYFPILPVWHQAKSNLDGSFGLYWNKYHADYISNIIVEGYKIISAGKKEKVLSVVRDVSDTYYIMNAIDYPGEYIFRLFVQDDYGFIYDTYAKMIHVTPFQDILNEDVIPEIILPEMSTFYNKSVIPVYFSIENKTDNKIETAVPVFYEYSLSDTEIEYEMTGYDNMKPKLLFSNLNTDTYLFLWDTVKQTEKMIKFNNNYLIDIKVITDNNEEYRCFLKHNVFIFSDTRYSNNLEIDDTNAIQTNIIVPDINNTIKYYNPNTGQRCDVILPDSFINDIRRYSLTIKDEKIDEYINTLSGDIISNERIINIELDTAYNSFNKDIKILLYYDDYNNDRIVDKTALLIEKSDVYYLNENIYEWEKVGYEDRNIEEKYIKFNAGHLSKYGIFYASSNLTYDDIFPVPNPFCPEDDDPENGEYYDAGKDNSGIIFYGMKQNMTIKIYTVSGFLVKEIIDQPENGQVQWDVRNTFDEQLGSGIYIYMVFENNEFVKDGKFAIINYKK